MRFWAPVADGLKAHEILAWGASPRNFHKEAASAESATEALLMMSGDEIGKQPATEP